jgi:hypothetical protein
MKRVVGIIVLGLCTGAAVAKLPPLSDEAKAKADETKAKAAWTDKVNAYKLCQVQDKVVAGYLAGAKKAGKDVKPVATAACVEPGPFAYTPPSDKPLEASGAHSPPGKAVSPPSKNTPAKDAQGPAKKS